MIDGSLTKKRTLIRACVVSVPIQPFTRGSLPTNGVSTLTRVAITLPEPRALKGAFTSMFIKLIQRKVIEAIKARKAPGVRRNGYSAPTPFNPTCRPVLDDPMFLIGITSNQTTKLLNRFRQDFPDNAAVAIIDRIVRMTPENIHLNSFMYEPIIDMSDEHLRNLYRDVKSLLQ